MKKKVILNILMAICILTAAGSAGYLAHYYYNSSRSEKEVGNLKDMIDEKELDEHSSTNGETELVSVDGVMVQKKFSELYRQNRDFVGWITIADTKVDYPVMHTPNDSERGEYYIRRDFEGNTSASGLPFIDKNCDILPPTDNVIIYGHNMNSGTMFHDTIKYEDKDFYESHKTFTFDTIYENSVYEVVAMFYGQIFEADSEKFKYYEFVNAGDEKEFAEYADNIKKMSIIDTGVDIAYGDKLLTLSTCAYHVKDGRFAVIARKKE